MKVLLVDDDRTVRFLLKVILVRSLNCTVLEAENGLDALDRLSEERVDLVILDINMPVLDGVETLRALRDSEDHASTPVIMISADRNDQLVRNCIALGINDYITKPFNSDQIAKRLMKYRRLAKPADAAHGESPATSDGAPLLSPGDSILVVEGNAEYRHFLVTVLQPRFDVLEAESGSRALKLAIENKPRAMLIGLGLGVLGAGHLVRHVRKLPGMSDVLLVGLLPKTATAGEREPFDRVLVRSFVPDTFLLEFDTLLQAGPSVSDEQVMERLREHLVSASQQFCGMVLATETTLVDKTPACDPQERFSARVLLETDDPPSLELEVRCDEASAALMFKQAVGSDPAAATDEDKVSVLGEAADIIAGRLQSALAERGIKTRNSVPALDHGSPGASPRQGEQEMYFTAPETGMSFRVRLAFSSERSAAAA